MRRVVTPVLVVVGALTALIAVALLRVGGAKTCRDVIVNEFAAACAEPKAASWALWTALVLGGLLGRLVARRTFGQR